MAKKQSARLIWPLVVLLVLAGLFLLLVDPFGWRKPSDDELKAQDPARLTLCAAQADDITAIEITKPQEDPFTLVRTGANWFLEKGGKRYRAEQMRVDSLLQDLPGLETDSIATDKADQLAGYEVDDAQGVRLIVYTGEKQVACDLLVGKAAPGYQMAFVRKPGEDKVYRASKNLKSSVGFDYASFRGKALWPFEPKGATEITVAKPGSSDTASFTKTGSDYWKNAGAGNANQNSLNELLTKFSELRVNEYVDDLTGVDTGLPETPAPQLIVKAPEGTFSLEIGKLDPELNQYFVRDQDGYISRVGDASLKFLLDTDIAVLKLEKLPEGAAAGAAIPATGAPGAPPAMPPAQAPPMAKPPAAPPAQGQ
jgi:hypothetical protein